MRAMCNPAVITKVDAFQARQLSSKVGHDFLRCQGMGFRVWGSGFQKLGT